MSRPRFTICIPTYQRAAMLPKALDSALAQTIGDFELVVVDNHSSDGTEAVMDGYRDSRIRYHRNPATVSMYGNHNICIERARGEWLVFLHSDDALAADALALIASYLDRYPQAATVFSHRVAHGALDRSHELIGPAGVATMFRWPSVCPSGTAYRARELAAAHFSDDGNLAADFRWILRLIASGHRVAIIPDTLVHIREGAHQASSSWLRSGRFFSDVGIVTREAFADHGVCAAVMREVAAWSPLETARLLMHLAHAELPRAIACIEDATRDRAYRRETYYQHVLVYRLLGRAGLRAIRANFWFVVDYIKRGKPWR